MPGIRAIIDSGSLQRAGAGCSYLVSVELFPSTVFFVFFFFWQISEKQHR